MFNGMTVGFVGSLIWGWGSRILVLKAFVQGGLQTDWLDSGQLLSKPSFLVPYCTHLALGRRVLSHPSTPCVSYLYTALACLLILCGRQAEPYGLSLKSG